MYLSKDPINVIIQNEGGYIDDPKDNGGPTKYGITWKTWEEFTGKKLENPTDIQYITREQAYQVYESKYLEVTGITNLTTGILETKVLDMAVNFGPNTGIKILQRSINKTKLFSLAVDGINGPKTVNAANKCYCWMARYFINVICDERNLLYKRLIIIRPDNKKFLQGWLNRSNKFRMKLPSTEELF